MTSRITSAILSRTSSIRRPNLNGLKDSIRHNISSDGSYGSNEYIHKNFFDDENYESILKCLNGGHQIATDLLEYMQDYIDLLEHFLEALQSYSGKWKSKINAQSSFSSYNTTKRAQIQTIGSSDSLAQLIQTRCTAIQQVITGYKRKVKQMYPHERLSTTRKHYRADVMKKLFENARSPLVKVSDELKKLGKQQKTAEAAFNDAQIQHQNLDLNEAASKSKLSSAKDQMNKRKSELDNIRDRIDQVKNQFEQEQKSYRQKAAEIYLECRELEEERLNQIRETLMEFTRAIYSTEFASEQDSIYAKLLSNIASEQNIHADLDFWARTYNVDTLQKSISADDEDKENNESQTTTRQTKKSANLTPIEENTTQSVTETKEDKTGTSTKGRTKNKKNSTAEPTTPDIAGLNQV